MKFCGISVWVFLSVLLSVKTYAQFPYKESFRNSTAPGITFGGSPTAFLTAAPGTAQGGGSIDKEGEGYLRLTNNTKNQKGYIISNAEFPSTNGLSVIFEYYIYGGTGADGISLFLFDAAANPFNIGGFGGSLGYAQITTTDPVSPGVSKAYIAIGMDEFGNFSNPNQGRQGGPGFRPGSVTLRGKGDGAALTPDNYKYLTSVQTANIPGDSFSLVGNATSRQPDSTSSGYRRVYMDLAPNPNGGYNVTVRIMRGGTPNHISTVINNYYYPEVAPAQLRYGIASSTGDYTNFHEIRNVSIDVFKIDGLVKPFAANDVASACTGKIAIIDVTSNDTTVNAGGSINKASIDLDPSAAGTQSSYTVPGQGTFSLNSDGTVQFTPESAFTGSVTGYYSVKDSYGKTSDPASITLNYVAAPPQPSAGNDSLLNIIGATGSYILQGSNPQGNAGRWTQVSGPNTAVFSNKTIQNPLVSNLTGGVYVFRWAVSAVSGCELFDDVQLTVNHRPVAVNDTVTTSLNTHIPIEILANDIDADGNSTLNKASVSIKSSPVNGTIVLDPVSGIITYRPNTAFTGYDSFVYSVKDNYGVESNTAIVTIAVNIKPEGSPDNAFTETNTPVKVVVLDNDRGRSGASVLKNTDPANGTIALNSDGTFTYTPTAGFSGKDTFTYLLQNKEGLQSDPITVTVNVRPAGSADITATLMATPVTIAVKDNDASKNGTTVYPNTNPLHGSIVVNSDGRVTYTPVAGFSGTDSCTYILRNTEGLESDPIKIKITVNPIPPNAPDIEVDASPGTPVKVDIPVPPGGTVIIKDPPEHGTVTVDPNTGEVIYTPDPGYSGPDDFTYVIKDGNGNESSPGRVIITVNRPAKIGLAKGVTSILKNPDGSYNVKFTFTVVNYGDFKLERLSVTDDLAAAFPGSVVTVKSINGSGNLHVNNSYNGTTDTELLLPSSYISAIWKETIDVEVAVALNDKDGTFYNTARATGYAEGSGTKVEDQSTNGLTPDPVSSGDPSPSELTPVKLVKEPLFIPGGFSPNNDGINDYFVIENALGKQISLEVYNRWGNRVYRSDNYQNGWNGKCTEGIHVGEDVPVGTYYYVITIDKTEKKVGYITINR